MNTVDSRNSSGASSADDIRSMKSHVVAIMGGNGCKGLTQGYEACIDRNGQAQNFGMVVVYADSEATAARYAAAKKRYADKAAAANELW